MRAKREALTVVYRTLYPRNEFAGDTRYGLRP